LVIYPSEKRNGKLLGNHAAGVLVNTSGSLLPLGEGLGMKA